MAFSPVKVGSRKAFSVRVWLRLYKNVAQTPNSSPMKRRLRKMILEAVADSLHALHGNEGRIINWQWVQNNEKNGRFWQALTEPV